jgi:PAS domain S-box-containing protein
MVAAVREGARLPGRVRGPWPIASLRSYLVASLLLAVVPLAALTTWGIARDDAASREAMTADLRRSASSLADAVQREVASSSDALAILASTSPLRRGDATAFQQGLRNGLRLRPSWSGVFLVDRRGPWRFDTAAEPASPALQRALAGDIQRTLRQQGPVVSKLLPVAPGRHATAVMLPVLVGDDQNYVLGAWIDPSHWQQILVSAGPPPGGFHSLYDEDWRVVARTLRPERHVGEALPAAAIAEFAGRPSGLVKTDVPVGGLSYCGWDRVAASDWSVGVCWPAAPRDAAQQRAMVFTIGTAALSLLAGLALALFVARRVTQPLDHLARMGPEAPREPIVVREIAALHEALHSARAEERLARDRLQRKADEFEALFEGSPIALSFAQDPACRVVKFNAAMSALLGQGGDASAAPVASFHEGRRLDADDQPLCRAATHGETVTALELELRRDGREPAYVLASAVPLLDADGRPRGAIAAAVEITERKNAQARLEAASARLRETQHMIDLAQEVGHVGFFEYRFDTGEANWTPGHARLLNLSLDHPHTVKVAPMAEGLAHIELADRAGIERDVRRMVATRQDKNTIEFRVRQPDGSQRWLSSRVLLLYEEGRPARLIGVTVDMTEQKSAERERGALIEREQTARLGAEAANRAKDEFLAMLSHELRNPLGAIASAVEVLKLASGDPALAAEARSVIERQTRHLGRMMDDLLDVARVISGKVMLTRQAVDLAALARRVASTVEMTGAAQAHTLAVTVEPTWADIDGTRIEQVIGNLLTNALKYTPPGGHIALDVRREGDDAVVTVRDNGEGMPEALLSRVFDLFVQGERTLDRRAGGLGIGLTLVRRLVELHGGRVEAQSSAQGSLFIVRLPAIEAPAAATPHAAGVPRRGQSISVVEDNEDAMHALCAMLQLDGHEVTMAGDGEQGVELVLAQRPDIAIVDIGLPKLTGFEVALACRRAGYTGRMIAVSGYGQASDVQRARSSGFDAHMLKPIDPEQLRALMLDE